MQNSKNLGVLFIQLLSVDLLVLKEYLNFQCCFTKIQARAVALNEDERSIRYIAAALNIPRSTVQYAIQRHCLTGNIQEGQDQAYLAPQTGEKTVLWSCLHYAIVVSGFFCPRVYDTT